MWRELYDLKADPEEQKNIIDKKPDVAKDLEKQLNQWIRRHKYETRKPPKGECDR